MKKLTFLFACITVCAQAQDLTQHGPSDTYYAVDLAFGRNNKAFLSTNGGLYFSDNMGSSWQKVNESFNNIYFEPIISKNKNDDIYACDRQGTIYYTKDNGVTWDFRYPIYPNNDNWIKAFAVYGDTVFIGTALGLKYISGSEPVPAITEVEELKGKDITAIHVSAKRVIVGTKLSGLYISEDLGITWSNIIDGFPSDFEVVDIQVLANNIFLATYWNGVYLSEDNGVNWTQINSGFNTLHLTDLYIDAETIYATTDSYENVYKCTVGDYTWQLIDAGIENEYAPTAIVGKDNDIILGAWHGVFASHDGGVSWALSLEGIHDAFVFKSMILTSDGSILATASHMGVYRKKPDKPTFQPFYNFNTNYGRAALEGTTLPIVTSHKIAFFDVVSETVVNEIPIQNVLFPDALVSLGSVYFLSTLQNGVYRQSSPGVWEAYSQGLPSLEIKELVSFNDHLYVATPAGLFIRGSSDTEWVKINLDVSDPGIEHLMLQGDIMLAAASFQTYISHDGGNNWTNVEDLKNFGLSAMLYHDGVIYAASFSRLWHSKDRGATWSAYDVPNNFFINSLLVLADRLYLATLENGILSIPISFTDVIMNTAPETLHAFSVSPNPGTGIFTIHTSGKPTLPENYLVRDILGRTVHAKIDGISGDESRLDLMDYPAGIYFLLTTRNDHQSIVRIIKK